jgi:tyrosyl-tRNA synthetase
MIQAGGVSINKAKLQDPNQAVAFGLLHDQYLFAQKGKKNYYLIRVD